MRNNRGYAIILVLLILAVISIMGAFLMTMSRLDMNLTAAVKNYDVLFNLADGACGIAFNDLRINERIPPVPTLFNQLPEQNIGNYSVSETLQAINVNPAGWELGQAGQGGGYHQEYWTGQGIANRVMGSLVVEVAVLKSLKQ